MIGGSAWARIDSTLWNLAFTGQAKAQRCKLCFSLAHSASDCDWAPAATVGSSGRRDVFIIIVMVASLFILRQRLSRVG